MQILRATCRSFLRSSSVLTLAFFLIFSSICSAQWVKESYPLKPGWNAIWLSHDCSSHSDDTTRSIGDVLAATPQIEEVWRWNPLGSSVQFIESPGAPIAKDIAWAVWRLGDPTNTTLSTLTGNSAYLVKVSPTAPSFTLQLTGKPLVPNYSFSSSGLNFLGFPAAATSPKFGDFFSFSEVLKNSPEIFKYNGGLLDNNPQKIVGTRNAPVNRGSAYWVKESAYTDYYGPLKVTVLGSGGVDFGRKLNTVTVRIKNVTDPGKNETVTAHFALSPSAAAPGEFSIAPGVALEVRGEFGPNLQFTRQSLADSAVTLAPGEETDLILIANRANMNVADESYASILSITDSLNHTRIDLPVSATGSSPNGVWIGAAILDSVNRVETISGPEFVAPTNTPNGAGPETRSVSTITATTNAGVTTHSTSYVVDFDVDGYADLSTAGVNSSNVALTSITDLDPATPDYIENIDYLVGPSVFATVTNPGSGYAEAPTVNFSDGAAEADAILSASVRRVKMRSGGSGYRNQQLALIFNQQQLAVTFNQQRAITFTGGDGIGAEGVMTIDQGRVVGVTITEGGSAYTSPPAIIFPLPLDGETAAAGTAVIEDGVVTSVIINSAGTGYGAGSGAEGVVTIDEGGVVGVEITEGGSAYTSPPVIVFPPALDGETRAAGTAVIENGVVTSVTIESAGTGYGAGSGAEGVVTIDQGRVVGVTITEGGSAYTSPPDIEFPLPLDGGPPATGTAVIEDGVVTSVMIDRGGTGYVTPMKVSFSGESVTEATGFAVVSESGIVTDVFITNGGTGYRTPPIVSISGGGGIGAFAEAEISGGIGKVLITGSGVNYAQAPTLSFTGGGGNGAEATVIVGDDGLVTGVDRLQKVDNESGPIGGRALVTISRSSPAVPGTPDGTVKSEVVSFSKVVTLNGRSRLITRRISNGGDAAAPSNFPIRLILHAPKSGTPKLLQRVFLGERDGIPYAGTSESSLAGIVTGPGESPPGTLGRSSTASFPIAGSWAADSGVWGDSASFTVLLGHNAATNPFVHSYHPDHDNWDARFERPEPNKVESYTVERMITFDFSAEPPAGLIEPGWGVTTLGGRYTETFTGLRAQEISVSGAFILYQVSEAAALIDNP